MTLLEVRKQTWPVKGTFRIARGARTDAVCVQVTLSNGNYKGRGECVPYERYGETVHSVIQQIKDQEKAVEGGATREDLQNLLPAGAARNALDCAFWDLEAKREGVRVWELIGLNEPKGLVTAYTLSIDSPDAMYRKAVENADRPLLKIKLGGEGDLERLAAVRQGAPDSEIIIDANEGWDLKKYVEMTRQLTSLGVTVVEQPLPAGVDSHLREIEHSLCICADEACHDRNSLKEITGKYDMVNIKLDKTGGLTEALELKRQAQAQGLKIMVGCMLGSSLAIAPAVVLAHDVEIVDLDGPLLLATDHAMPISYNRSKLQAPSAHLWG